LVNKENVIHQLASLVTFQQTNFGQQIYRTNKTPTEPKSLDAKPGFNPGFTPPFISEMQGVKPGLNPGFGVLRCGTRIQGCMTILKLYKQQILL
jgi:hypothetical protein